MALFQIGLRIVCILFCAFMGYCFWMLYRLRHPTPCPSGSNYCLKNYLANTSHPLLKLWVYSSTSQFPNGCDLYLVWELNDFKPDENITKDVTVRIPLGMHSNGTMFVHVFIAPAEEGRGEENPFDADWMVHKTGTLTTYAIHQPTALQIISDNPAEKELVAADHLTCHWRSFLTLNVMTANDITFYRRAVPGGIMDYLRVHENQYLPLLLIDEISYRTKDLLPLNSSCKEMPLTIIYMPVSYSKFCWGDILKEVVKPEKPGLTEKEIEDLKGVYMTNDPHVRIREDLKDIIDTTGAIIRLEFQMSILNKTLPLLFELLAIESDVSFWQKRATMGGLSTQTVVWRSVGTVVYVLYLMKEQKMEPFNQTVLGFVSIIEIWKVFRVFRARVCWTEWRLVFDNVGVGNRERETQAFDSQAMRWLSCVLYPSWIAVIIYTVIYNFQKSWYSLCILSLVNGFHSFGFLFMLPQVVINYKLKSVADLPWTALTLRDASTVIQDICRFILVMPIEDGGAWFRDDVIFVIYLYQRWLYSV